MNKPARGWRTKYPAALVVIGWLCFIAALVTENPVVRGFFLVAARALPPVLACHVDRCSELL
jgi:hypothetical protein